jgi:hypothetical protein
MKRINYIGLLFALTFLPGSFILSSRASAQSPQNSPALTQNVAPAQEQSLGDVARKVAHKDTDPAKAKPKVFDNDNLPTDDKISVVGHPTDASIASNAASDPNAKPTDANASKPSDDQAKKQTEWKSWQDKTTAQKEQIDLASRELDVLQREYQLRAAEMYADAGNRLRNSGQWDKEDADYKQKIADKQKAVDDAKQKLVDMQEQGRKAGVPSSMIE